MPLDNVKLTDMKRKPRKKRQRMAEVSFEPSPYPHGLNISLENEDLEKLGFKELPGVGSKKVLYAIGEVTDVSEHDRQGQKPRRRVEIQLQRVECRDLPSARNTAKRTYSGKK